MAGTASWVSDSVDVAEFERGWAKRLEGWEQQWRDLIGRHLERQRKVVLARLGGPKALKYTRHDRNEVTRSTKALDPTKIVDSDRWASDLTTDSAGLFVRIYDGSGTATMKALDDATSGTLTHRAKGESLWNSRDPQIAKSIEARQVRIKDFSDRQAQVVRDDIAQAESEGLTVAEISDRLQELYDTWGPVWADRVARTETVGAINDASLIAAVQSEVVDTKQWVALLDDHVRPTHEEADGQVVALDEAFTVGDAELMYPGDPDGPPEETINCFPASVRVAGVIERGYRYWYSGPMVTVHTRSGRVLTGTPNHPVLTARGWTALDALCVGDDLACAASSVQWHGIGDPHEHQVQPCIGDCVETLLSRCAMRRRVIVERVNFHGDVPDNNVDAVDADGHLLLGLRTRAPKRAAEPVLERADREAAVASTLFATTSDAFGWVALPTPSVVSSASARHSFSDSHAGSRDTVSVAERAPFDPGSNETPRNAPTVDAIALGNRLLGLAVAITTDNVVDVEHDWFTGHVYNLQTVTGAYLANGVVTQNCRCVLIYSLGAPEGTGNPGSEEDVAAADPARLVLDYTGPVGVLRFARKYEGQPRDEHGRFGEGTQGGGAQEGEAAGAISQYYTVVAPGGIETIRQNRVRQPIEKQLAKTLGIPANHVNLAHLSNESKQMVVDRCERFAARFPEAATSLSDVIVQNFAETPGLTENHADQMFAVVTYGTGADKGDCYLRINSQWFGDDAKLGAVLAQAAQPMSNGTIIDSMKPYASTENVNRDGMSSYHPLSTPASVIDHELGHVVDHTYGVSSRMMADPAMKDANELLRFGGYSLHSPREAFAEMYAVQQSQGAAGLNSRSASLAYAYADAMDRARGLKRLKALTVDDLAEPPLLAPGSPSDEPPWLPPWVEEQWRADGRWPAPPATKWDPNQARDEHGMWTVEEGAGPLEPGGWLPGSAAPTAAPAPTPKEPPTPKGLTGVSNGSTISDATVGLGQPMAQGTLQGANVEKFFLDGLTSNTMNAATTPTQASEAKAEVVADLTQRMEGVSTTVLVAATMSSYGLSVPAENYGNLNYVFARASDGSMYTVRGPGSTGSVAEALANNPGAVRGGTPEAERMVRESACNQMIRTWADTSNDSSALSHAMQIAAGDTFGVEHVVPWSGSGKDAENLGRELYEQNPGVFKAFLTAQYNATQERFKEWGVTHVQVYRGQSRALKGDDATKLRPLSSFSTKALTAKGFGVNHYAALVPVERVLSTPRTGLGCLDEREVVVIAGPGKVNEL